VQSRLRPRSRTKVLAIANNKGGVGKTTTALNIGFNLAKRDKSVLLVDLDAQGNLTYSLPYKANNSPHHLADYFLHRGGTGGSSLPQLVRPTEFQNICVIPSHPDLSLAESDLDDWTRIEHQFAEDLHDDAVIAPHEVGGSEFDWIILDTPPAMGIATRAALAA